MESDEEHWPARFVPIGGNHNLRDMGGYLTRDGRQTKWRTLYRSGVMSGLTVEDRDAFRCLGIVAMFDLRANDEREHRPTEWHHGEDIEYYSRDHDFSVGALNNLLEKGDLTADLLRAEIHDVYRLMPFVQADSYRQLFRLLIDAKVPLMFNCTAGKDRTGVAAALILDALDIPREAIEQDYALTERGVEQLISILLSDPKYSALHSVARDHYLPIVRADPAYLNVAFQEIERRHSSVRGYLDSVLGIGRREIDALREVLLTT